MNTLLNDNKFITMINIMHEVCIGNSENVDSLFELTKNGSYSAEIVNLAESFCMMLVKNDAKQQHVELLMEELRKHNKYLEHTVAERTMELNASLIRLESANRIVRQTFGRYLSEKVVNDILSSPDGSALGGASRLITIMMTDLRGFTSISEMLPAKDVLTIINIYLERMTEIVMKYDGTIIELFGDAILAVFGAPVSHKDDAQRGIACAIEMQNAMTEVNASCKELGYPQIEQGIGINTGESVVGNVGSDKRTKYDIVGMNVNLTSRIESYTVGGQILVSEATAEACGSILRVSNTLEVMPKGVNKPITLFDVAGIEGDFNIFLSSKPAAELITFMDRILAKNSDDRKQEF